MMIRPIEPDEPEDEKEGEQIDGIDLNFDQ